MQDVHARRAGTWRGRCSVVAWAGVVAAAAAMGWTSSAVAGAFLNVQGVPGESTNAAHPGEIDIVSHDLSLVVPPSTASTSGRGSGKVSCPPVTLYKYLDSASLILAKKLIQGVHFPQMVLTLQRDGGDHADYYVLTMKEVLVTEFAQTSSAEVSRGAEKVVLTARRYDFEYRPQSTSGAPAGVIKMGWDCVTYEVI